MATLTMPEAFLQDVIEHRDDDAPRLVYADWLEERGEQARAEFIRVQCETVKWWTICAAHDPARKKCPGCVLRRRERELLAAGWAGWHPGLGSRHVFCANLFTAPPCPDPNVSFRRGFVAEITCRLGDWCGGPCGRCGGTGNVRAPRPVSNPPCPECGGRCRAPGHGPALVRAAPLERVTLSDREPFGYTAADRPTYLWRCVTNGYGNERNLLPVALFDALPGHEHGHVAEYAARQEAESALSEACLAWARSQPVTS